MIDPIYSAGFDAGRSASVAFLEGRAEMAREMGRPVDATVLDAARQALARLGKAHPNLVAALGRVREFVESEVENRNTAGEVTDYQADAEAARADLDLVIATLAGEA